MLTSSEYMTRVHAHAPGVRPGLVRHWVSTGLVTPPTGRGPGTRWSVEAVDDAVRQARVQRVIAALRTSPPDVVDAIVQSARACGAIE